MGRGRLSRTRMWKKKKMTQINPTFFKVLFSVRDFRGRLRVPPVFVKNYFQGSSLPSKVHLMTSCNYSRSGRSSVSWRVKMEKDEKGCHITQGWPDIVKDLVLREGDFLVFQLLGAEELGVVPYAPTCCEKRIDIKHLIRSKEQEGRSGVKVKTEDDDDDDRYIQIDDETSEEEERSRAGRPSSFAKNQNPSFVRSLTKCDMTILIIPAAVATGAKQWTKRSAVIKCPGGGKWSVAIKLRITSSRRLDISSGWREFIRDNGMSIGDTVRFEFLGGWDNVIEARVLSKASIGREFVRGN